MGLLSQLHTSFVDTAVDALNGLDAQIDLAHDAGTDYAADGAHLEAAHEMPSGGMEGDTNLPLDLMKLDDKAMAAKMEALFGQAPKPDFAKMDLEGMAKLRLSAFEGEDADSARTWAANLSELKKSCFGADELKGCQVLSTESMYMAAKYYQMWDESMNMWADMNSAGGAHDIAGADIDATAAMGTGTMDAAADATMHAGSMDAGAMDAGAMDAGAMDAGAMDAGVMDAGAVDMDAGVVDTDVDADVADLSEMSIAEASMPLAALFGAVAMGSNLMGSNLMPSFQGWSQGGDVEKRQAEKCFL